MYKCTEVYSGGIMMREKVLVLMVSMVCGYLGYLGALSLNSLPTQNFYNQTVVK